jgi:DNA polymerase-3 subunit delta'
MLPWHEPLLGQLTALYEDGRLPHAILVRGEEGWGETALGAALALALLGIRPDADARSVAHPDLKWIAPEGAILRVDDVRTLAEFAVGTRQSAPCKVGVVESADLMNVNAANALLKTLEEPPADTYLILTTSRPARLLPTIVSRCQQFSLTRDAALARRWLESECGTAGLDEKCFECGDAPLAVKAALADEEPPLGPLLEALAARGGVSRSIGPLLDWNVDRLTAGWYRHCVALLGGGRRLDLPPAEPRALNAFVDELKSVRRQLLTTNSANQRLLYERLAAKWYGVFHP